MNPKEISIGFYTEARTFGGGERALSIILKHLDLDKFDISVFIMNNLWQYDAFTEARKRISEVHYLDELVNQMQKTNQQIFTNFRYRGIFFSIKNAILISRYILKYSNKLDILHVVNAFNFDAILASHISGIKTKVGSIRLLPKNSYAEEKAHQKLWFQRFLLNSLSKIIVPSNICKIEWSKSMQIPLDKFTVVNNGVDSNEFTYTNKSATAEKKWLNLDPMNLTIIVVASLAQHKGHETLLNALALLKKEDFSPFPQTVFVGTGPLHDHLQNIITKFDLDNSVHLIGFCENVNRVYQAADVVILPTLYESFGNVLLEAMAAGKPIIASKTGGVPEIINDEETGILVPSGDPVSLAEAIKVLCLDENLRQRMGLAGKFRVLNHFTIENMIKGTEDVYNETSGINYRI